jgi:Ni/Fe-hydrogenase subunit HybB-like protein
MGPYAGVVFWNWTAAGIILPLVLLITPLGRHLWAQRVAALGVLWGSYAVRLIVMIGGEAQVRSGAGYESFVPSMETWTYTALSVLLFIGVLAVLLLAFSADRVPELEQSSAH